MRKVIRMQEGVTIRFSGVTQASVRDRVGGGADLNLKGFFGKTQIGFSDQVHHE